MGIEWNWGIFLEPTPYGDTTYLGWVWLGVQMTFLLSLASAIVAFLVGSFFGVLRTLPNKLLRTLGASYVEIFRNIPLIVQLFLWVFVVPEFLPTVLKKALFALDPNTFVFLMSVIGLGLYTGIRFCEQLRSAIDSLPKGQMQAGKALGFNVKQIYFYILLPNAYRKILPPISSELLSLVKNSSIASTLGMVELTKQANQIMEVSGYPYESFAAIILGYVTINFSILKVMQLLEKRLRLPNFIGGK